MPKNREYNFKRNGKNKGKTVTAPATYPAEVAPVPLQDVVTRCPHGGCNRILFKGSLGVGTNFEIQCPSCGGYLAMVVAAKN